MAVEKIHIGRFLELAASFPILDVRSPGEFKHACIPGAYSLPLFTDEERKIVGTTYKQQSREAAIKIGLDFFGPKMRKMVEEVEALVANLRMDVKGVIVHCWRGGMRSAGVAWLLDLYGFKVYTLVGGYKAFRKWSLAQFEKPYNFNILGGYTGSGKTEVLKGLPQHQVVDLEAIAGHKGSAFGNIGLPVQPSQEMFENKLAMELNGKQMPIWLEDESQRIGTVNIPQKLWLTMRSSPVYFLDIPFEQRLEHIIAEYGSLDKVKVREAIERLQKRLGGLETKTALAHLDEGDMYGCFRILLKYYDKYYSKALKSRSNLNELLTTIQCKEAGIANSALLLKQIEFAQ